MADSCGNADPGARGAATTRALVQANTPPLLMNADPAEGLCVTRSRGAREITCAQANLVPATATREIDRVLSEVREQKRPGYRLIATWYRAQWINPVVRGWMQYYGAFYRSALNPLLSRINAYVMRWIRNKYKRLRTTKKAKACWQRITRQHPRLFAHWASVHGSWWTG